MAAELLKNPDELVKQKIHPTSIMAETDEQNEGQRNHTFLALMASRGHTYPSASYQSYYPAPKYGGEYMPQYDGYQPPSYGGGYGYPKPMPPSTISGLKVLRISGKCLA